MSLTISLLGLALALLWIPLGLNHFYLALHSGVVGQIKRGLQPALTQRLWYPGLVVLAVLGLLLFIQQV